MIPDLRRWREVPMPQAVARLPRDKRGFPIPWVSEWTENRDGEAQMKPRQERGLTAGHCSCEIGYGTPDLGNVCPTRQRAGMLDRLCGVCGAALGARAIFMGHVENETYTEPPVHLACGLYAAQVCPGLITPTKVANVGVAIARRWTTPRSKVVLPPDGEQGIVDTALVPLYGAIVMMVIAEPVGGERMTLDAFLDKHLAGAR